MYRQIKISSEDTSLQRILWRFNSTDPIEEYELQTVTYGLSPSSFIATRVLKQLAIEAKGKYEYGSTAVESDFYMDDFISGAESVQRAKILQQEVQILLAEGGFKLRKWCSNQPEILKNIPVEDLETSDILRLDPEHKIKTLGVVWQPGTDELCIDVKITENVDIWTKRKVFSKIAQLFDPLGLISPVVAWAKIHMQHIWLAGIGWDDMVPNNILSKWEQYVMQLPSLNAYKISRFVLVDRPKDIQFHVFTDASEMGYGACMYARTVDKYDIIKSELITAKSRVAPLKRLSLPRLELCAALLGAKLYARVSAALQMEGIPCFFWCDSTVTLHWIRAPPNNWHTFVGNRTSEIHHLTSGQQWQHINGAENPADYVSRGMLPNDFLSCDNWRTGPPWLSETQSKWPKQFQLAVVPDETLERRKIVSLMQQTSSHNFLFERFSSFSRLIRITAYLIRFIQNCRSKQSRNLDSFFHVAELKNATEILVKQAQEEEFKEERLYLSTNKPLSGRSPLKLLNVFIDQKGIIRIGGRLQHSGEQYNTKHPIVLPKSHPLSRLIAVHYHAQSLHSGPRMTLASMRREYWPVGGKNLVNSVCRKCLICFRHNPVPVTQPVGQLPRSRTIPGRPFTITGVDYCGPVYLKPTHRRATPRKAFIAVFVCFATKAVHLELVCDLSTEAFIAALRRFIARRGIPSEIHSDNGTNFKGAKNTLTELHRTLSTPKATSTITKECSENKIIWRFIPPRAPSFGGLWEAAVKTAKGALTKTLGTHKLSYEDFVTILTQVEAVMNSRPLTPLSEDPAELNVLTPGHFLIGSPLNSLPEPDYSHVPMNRLRHYQQLQKLFNDCWVRWRKEYLTELNLQHKRSSAPIILKEGQLVLMMDENKPSVSWPLGRIMEIHPGEDGVIRVVTIRTANGAYKRPASKIFPLPSQEPIQGHVTQPENN